MHEPSDSSLLWDAVRVMARLLKAADALIGGLAWRNHRRAAKKRARAIEYARNQPTRIQLYREWIRECQESCVRGRFSHHALTNLSSNMMANWVLASHHSRGGIFHVCATLCKTRYSN